MCTSKTDRKMLTCCQGPPSGTTSVWPGPAYIPLPSASATTVSSSTGALSTRRTGSRMNATRPAGKPGWPVDCQFTRLYDSLYCTHRLQHVSSTKNVTRQQNDEL